MSYKTSLVSKVLGTKPSNKDEKSKVKDTAVKVSDAYNDASKNSYQKLCSGVVELPERMEEQRYRAVQDVLGGLMLPETRVQHTLPAVPKLEEDIFALNSEQHMHMKPIVERYVALEKVINAHITENNALLDPDNMSLLTTDEVEDLWRYHYELQETLRECHEELSKARMYYQWEKQNRAAAFESEENDI